MEGFKFQLDSRAGLRTRTAKQRFDFQKLSQEFIPRKLAEINIPPGVPNKESAFGSFLFGMLAMRAAPP
jgi:hypothetical protein